MCSEHREGWTDTNPHRKEVHAGAAKALPNLCSTKNPGGEPVPQRLGKVIKQKKKKLGGNLPVFVSGVCTDSLGKREGGW